MSERLKMMIRALRDMGFEWTEIADDAGVTIPTITNGMRGTATSGNNERKLESAFRRLIEKRENQVNLAKELI